MDARRRDNRRIDGGRIDGGSEDMGSVFRRLAVGYVEKEGEKLRAENEACAAEAPFAVSDGFRDKVYAKIRREKYIRAYYAIGAVAACFLVAFIGIFAINGMNSRTSAPAQYEAAGSAPGETYSDSIHSDGTYSDGTYSFDGADGTDDSEGSEDSEATSGSEGSGGDGRYEPIALSYSLPAHLSVADVEQDKGQTVFYIDNAEDDDIVLIAERSEQIGGSGKFDKDALQASGLRPIRINGTELYAVARADYSLVTFQSEGVIYSATCKHDYRTLISLCEYIL